MRFVVVAGKRPPNFQVILNVHSKMLPTFGFLFVAEKFDTRLFVNLLFS